jgi:hypothetical protein
MIIEGLVTCQSESGPHVAALGPVVNEDLSEWTLRPFQSSRIFALLREHSTCVFHVTDDVLPIVQLVLGVEPQLAYDRLASGEWILREACHWYHLEITSWNLASQRSEARARLLAQADLRPFWGWNRAKHALLEAAILISRVHITTRSELSDSLERLRSPIEKTAGPRELAAWQLVQQWRERL